MVLQRRSWQNGWQLYALALLIVGLLILAHYLAPSPGWRIFLDSGVIIVGYGLIIVWLETHSTTLLHQSPSDLANQMFESEGELSSLESSPVEFHLGSPPIISGIPEFPSDNLRANGHHPAPTIPSFPKDVSNN